ncbi:MAG: invasion associated locus B family protein [Rhodobacteraceae bacterium]|nr:invasion associated locus B family protein [Paracoccaceae bacterium]
MFRLAATLALLLALPVAAQEAATPEPLPDAAAERLANGTRFGTWTLGCEAVAVGETACLLSQRVARTSDGAFLADFLLFPNPQAEGEVYLAARVAAGAYLPSGFVLRGEGAPEDSQRQLVWQTCAGAVCEALLSLPEADIAALEDGGDVIAAYRPSVQSEAVIFRFSVAGAQAGLEALVRASGGN